MSRPYPLSGLTSARHLPYERFREKGASGFALPPNAQKDQKRFLISQFQLSFHMFIKRASTKWRRVSNRSVMRSVESLQEKSDEQTFSR